MLEQQRAMRGVAFRRPAPGRSLVTRACILLAILVIGLGARLAHAATFTGTVFEDANYGGGAGRSLRDVGRRCRWRTSRSSCIASVTAISSPPTTTNASGVYSLTSRVAPALPMYVRVVNGTVRSSRTGGAACTTCVPVQTFRTDASERHGGGRHQSRGRRGAGLERCGR